VIVDCALYDAGERVGGRLDLPDALQALQAVPESESAFVWIGLRDPEPEEFHEVTDEFGLHPLAVEDAIHARQRPKLEIYGDTVFAVLKPARYVDSQEIVELSQVMVFLGERFVITVRHGESDVLRDVRRDIADAPDELRCGPIGVLHAIVDHVVDDYATVVSGLDVEVEEVEEQVFS
jgi:magnesium transporter